MKAYLNGVALTSLSPSIVLLDVEELPPEMDAQTQPRGQSDGMAVTLEHRRALKIRLKMEIHESNMARRKAICTKIAAWASKSGRLTLSDRPGQALDVRCETLPVLSSALHWTQPVTLTLAALDFPYWRSDRAATVNSAGATWHALTLRPAGNAAPVPLEAQIRNVSSSAVTAVTIATPLGTFSFEGLALYPWQTLTVTEIAGLPAALVDGSSVLRCRTPQSADRLRVSSGADNAITVSADQAVEVSLSARGAWF